MNEANQPTTVTVRALLAHFHSILDQARRTGEPVIIALRGRLSAGVLLGYEAWEAGRAELAAERQRGAAMAAELAAARRQVEETSRDLAVARQRAAELEAQLARPQPADLPGAGWRIATSSEAPAPRLPETWTGQPRGRSDVQKPPVQEGWGQSSPE